MENKKEIFVIRPSEPIHMSPIVRDPNEIQKVYDLGIKDSLNLIEQLKDYIVKK